MASACCSRRWANNDDGILVRGDPTGKDPRGKVAARAQLRRGREGLDMPWPLRFCGRLTGLSQRRGTSVRGDPTIKGPQGKVAAPD